MLEKLIRKPAKSQRLLADLRNPDLILSIP